MLKCSFLLLQLAFYDIIKLNNSIMVEIKKAVI